MQERRKARKKEKCTREGERHERRRKARKEKGMKGGKKEEEKECELKKRRKVAMTKYMDTNRITIKKTTNRQQDC